ncbi:HNH endonuclease family protein [Streptomyces sp. NPDC058739]|uniref:HNH endonuclease family protein n=1 Tax=Streptomyces sp. NPDC058739 TaxID=3346618 RepID=UPI0036BA9514
MRLRQRQWTLSLTAVTLTMVIAGCSGLAAEPTPAASVPPEARGIPAAGGERADAAASLPGLPSTKQAFIALDGLAVVAHRSMTSYNRSKFPHWNTQKDSCDTRETVLERDGIDVQQDGECRAISGRWVSAYDGEASTDASELEVDHLVPLANAWQSGADKWTQEERGAFANDLTHPQLLAVSAASNRSKGHQAPDEWQPPSKTYWCTYARAWVSVKSTYRLSVTEQEKTKLTDMLRTCPS